MQAKSNVRKHEIQIQLITKINHIAYVLYGVTNRYWNFITWSDRD